MATPEQGMASMFRNLEEKTGKSLERWIAIARKSKFTKHGEIVKHLKTEHGLTHGYAAGVAQATLRADAGSDGGSLIDAQYSGTKAAMRPVYEALISAVKKLGKDVEISPKKTYVSLRRSKQFGLIQPASSRVDVGINLKGAKPTARLESSGSFNAMVSHRVSVESKDQIDAELLRWLERAYEMA